MIGQVTHIVPWLGLPGASRLEVDASEPPFLLAWPRHLWHTHSMSCLGYQLLAMVAYFTCLTAKSGPLCQARTCAHVCVCAWVWVGGGGGGGGGAECRILGRYSNFDEYVVLMYIANCAKSEHSHFSIPRARLLVLLDNDRCFTAEDAMAEAPESHRNRGAVFAAIALQTCPRIPTSLVRAIGAFSRLGAAFLSRWGVGADLTGDPSIALPEAIARAATLYAHLCACDSQHACGTGWLLRAFDALGPRDLVELST